MCVTDAKPDTIKRGYRLVGSGSPAVVFKIHRVHKVPFCSLQGRCLLLDSLAGPGSPIVNGDEVAIETDQSCFLYPGPDDVPRSDRAAVNRFPAGDRVQGDLAALVQGDSAARRRFRRTHSDLLRWRGRVLLDESQLVAFLWNLDLADCAERERVQHYSLKKNRGVLGDAHDTA